MRFPTEYWFLLMLLINTVVAVLYLIFTLLFRRKRVRSYWMRFCIMLFCPVAGIGYFFLSWIMFHVVFHKPVDLSDVVFSKDRIESISKANEEEERNLVSVEEAIAVTNQEDLRTLMLNVIRRDSAASLSSIALALNSEDSETSHYAAAVLQQALSGFRSNVQRDYQMLLEAEEKDAEVICAILDYMNTTLEKRVFTDVEQKHFVLMMDEIGQFLYDGEPKDAPCRTLEQLALRLMEIEEYEKSEVWCTRMAGRYPDELAAFTCRLRLYYATHDQAAFFRTLEELKASDVLLDQETLALVRLYS